MPAKSEKGLVIYKRIDAFFQQIISYKDSGAVERYFEFLKKVPYNAPFNNTLVYIQNPMSSYYATAPQWEKRFGRYVKEGARPMVVLFPFGPVDFVYDISDTEGPQLTDEDMIFWWRENGGTLEDNVISRTVDNMKELGIMYNSESIGTYVGRVSGRTAGYASIAENNSYLVTLHPRYNKSSVEAYGVICHELAHILLGHLGEVAVYKENKKGEKVKTIITENRRHVPRHICELEAELSAWIVFSNIGIEKSSIPYLATWLRNEEDIRELNISEVLKAVRKIEEMGRKILK